MSLGRWRIEPSPTALSDVRRQVRDLAVGAPTAAVYDAQMVAVELVTNAWLHSDGAARLSVRVDDDVIRIEVGDEGHSLPMLQPVDGEATVGRGLRLVSALTTAWGVRVEETTKVVWADVPLARQAQQSSDQAPFDPDALVSSWDKATRSETTYPVCITGIPVELLRSARAHVADVVRELQVVAAGEREDRPPFVPDLDELIGGLEIYWEHGRRELERQFSAALIGNDAEIVIELRLPASARVEGTQFLSALDTAQKLARTGQLLTPSAPASFMIFWRWWVAAIDGQLEDHLQGRSPRRHQPLSVAVSQEVDWIAGRAAAWDRLQLLQTVTGELTRAGTESEVASIIADKAIQHLGALAVRVYIADSEGRMRSRAWHGADWNSSDAPFESFDLNDELPGAVVARTGRPLLLRSLEEIYTAFPGLRDHYATQRSLLMHPVQIGGQILGLLGLTLPPTRDDEDEQVSFVQALADALAQALERVRAIEKAEARADRLRLTAEASIALNASLDFQATVDAVAHVLVPRLADWAVVQVLRDDRLENVSVHHPDPDKLRWARSLEGRWPVDMQAQTGAPAVLRTGRSELYSVIPDELVEAGAVDAEHLAALQALGMRSALVVPLAGRSGNIGAISLIYAESGRHYGSDDLALVEDIARRAALALESAVTLREQSGRLADVVRVADAAQRAILPELPQRIGPVGIAAAYRSSAAEATIGGDFFEAVPFRDGVRLVIGDVRGKGLAAIRTASLVLGAARFLAEELTELDEVIATIDRRLRRHLGEEDFVTACIVEISPAGQYHLVSAGHPAPLLVRHSAITPFQVSPSPPLGLDAHPVTVSGQLLLGDRLLLYTDGLVEARGQDGRFVPLERLVGGMADRELHEAVASVLQRLDAETSRADDDLALLAVEYVPVPQPTLASNSAARTSLA